MSKKNFTIVFLLVCLYVVVHSQVAQSLDGRVLVRLQNRAITALDASPDDQTIACGVQLTEYPVDRNRCSVELRNSTTGKLLRTLKASVGTLTAVAFSPNSRLVAGAVGTGGWRLRSEADPPWPAILGKVYVWSTRTGQLKHKFTLASGQVLSIAFSPKSRYVAVGCGDATLLLWDLSSGKSKWVVKGQGKHVSSVAFSPSGDTIVTASMDDKVRLWDAKTGKLQRVFSNQDRSDVFAATFSPDGRLIVSASRVLLSLWEVKDGRMLRSLGGPELVSHLKFSPDGRLLAASGYEGDVTVWDMSTSRGKLRIETKLRMSPCAFSASGNTLIMGRSGDYVTGDYESTIELYDMR